jgi:hypothetical protein
MDLDDTESGEDLGLILSRRLFHMLEKDWSNGDAKFKYKSDILGKLIQSHFSLNPGVCFIFYPHAPFFYL